MQSAQTTRELALDLSTSQSTICRYLKKTRKVFERETEREGGRLDG